MVFLACLSLLGYCFALTRFSKLPIEYGPFFVISACTVLLYIFAYLHFLKMGADIILILGALFFLLSPIMLYSDKQNLWVRYLTPGFVISSAFLAVFLSLAHGVHLSQWDEFTQWGPHDKLVNLNNGFINAANVAIHKSYPEGGALFHYLFFRLTGYSEAVSYVAQCLLIMAPLSIFVAGYEWCAWKSVFIVYGFTLFVLILLKVQIGLAGSLYMDSAVGIYFGMCMVAFLKSDKSIAAILYLLPMIAAMTLFKQKLLPLILLIAAIILIDNFLRRRQLENWVLRLIAIALIPIVSFCITQSWHHYLAITHVPVEWKLHFTYAKIYDAFTAKPGSFFYIVIANFCRALIPVILFLTIILIFNIITIYFKKQKANFYVLHLALLCGFALYLFGLLLMYLFSFQSYESIVHISMSRYLHIYYLGWALVTLYFLFEAASALSEKYDNILAYAVIIVITAGFLLLFVHQNKKNSEPDSTWNLRQPIIQIANAVKKITSPHAKIFTIWQDSAGLERGMLVYELTPRIPNLGCTSFGKPYALGDVWTCNVSAKNFAHQIASFHYVLLAYTDLNFWSHYGIVFPKHSKPLLIYSICHGTTFRSFRAPGCAMKKYPAYLFKVIKENGRIKLENIHE